MPQFLILLKPYINVLSFSWIKKCIFFRNMEPLKSIFNYLLDEWQTARNLISIVASDLILHGCPGLIVLIYRANTVYPFKVHINHFIARFLYNTVSDITRFKGGSQKCIDYIEKRP